MVNIIIHASQCKTPVQKLCRATAHVLRTDTSMFIHCQFGLQVLLNNPKPAAEFVTSELGRPYPLIPTWTPKVCRMIAS